MPVAVDLHGHLAMLEPGDSLKVEMPRE